MKGLGRIGSMVEAGSASPRSPLVRLPGHRALTTALAALAVVVALAAAASPAFAQSAYVVGPGGASAKSC